MYIEQDEFSGRPIAEDAYPSLAAFREAGGLAFHNFSIEEVRSRYVSSCESAPLNETEEPVQTDFTIGRFQVRLYDPRSNVVAGEKTSAVLFLHGGGWVMGDLRTHHFAARRIATRTGVPVLAVDYRLAPEHPYPAAIDDSRAALKWILDPNQPHKLNVFGLSIIGDSAGGQLAAVLTNEFHLTAPIKSQILLYPVTDIRDENMANSESYQRISEGFPLVAKTMEWFADNYVERGSIRENPDLSPQCAEVDHRLPSTLIITVDNDPLADEGARYADKLRTAGVSVQYEHLIGYAHGLFTSAGKIQAGERYLNRAADFISSEFQGPPVSIETASQ